MTKRLGQMIDEGKIDLDQYLIMHPFSASTKKVYEEALRGIDFFNELYIKNNKTYERLAIISKVFNNAERNLVVVTGYRGCGKTNFLKLVQYISDGNKPLEGFEERRKKDLENTDNINDVNEKYAISLQVIKRILFNELHGLNEENSSDALTNYIYEHLAGKCKYINFDEGGMGKDKPFSEKLCYNMRRSVDNHTHDGRLAEIVSKVDDFFRRNRWTIEENFVEIDFGAIKNFWDTVKPELAQEESDSVYETLLSELKKLSLEQLLFVYTIWEYAEIITANRLPNERKLTYLLDNIDIISDGTTDIFKNTMMGIWRFVWDTKNVFLKIYEKGDVKDQAFIELYDKTNIVVAMRETTAMHISGHLRDRMREIMDHFDMSEDVDKTVVMQKKLDFALDMIKNGEVKKTGFIETVNCLNQIIDDKLFMKNIFLLFDNDYRTAMRCIKAICTEHLNEVENAIGLIKADDNHCVFGGRGIIYRLLIDHFFKWKYFDDMGIPSTKYAGETKIALMDNSSLAFMHELSQRSYPSDGILSVYDLILIPKWVMEEIEDSTYRSTYVEQLQAQGYPIRWIDETKYGAFVNDEDVNLYYIVEAAVSRVSELMRFLRRKVKTEDLIDLPSAEEWMNRLYDEWPIHGRTLSTGRTLKKNAGEISLTILAEIFAWYHDGVDSLTIYTQDTDAHEFQTNAERILTGNSEFTPALDSPISVAFKSNDFILCQMYREGALTLDAVRQLRHDDRKLTYTRQQADKSIICRKEVITKEQFIDLIQDATVQILF